MSKTITIVVNNISDEMYDALNKTKEEVISDHNMGDFDPSKDDKIEIDGNECPEDQLIKLIGLGYAIKITEEDMKRRGFSKADIDAALAAGDGKKLLDMLLSLSK